VIQLKGTFLQGESNMASIKALLIVLTTSAALAAPLLFSSAHAAGLYDKEQIFDSSFYDEAFTTPSVPSSVGSYYFRANVTIDNADDYRPIAVYGGKDFHDIEIYLKPVAGNPAYFYVNHNRANGGFFYSVAYPFVAKNGRSLVGKSVLIEVLYAFKDGTTEPDLIVKFNGRVQEPFPIIANNGFNNVFGMRPPVVTGDRWIIGRIDHSQFGIRQFEGRMRNLEIGFDAQMLSDIQSASERPLVVNDALTRIISSTVNSEELIPVSILLNAPDSLDTSLASWDEIAELQNQFHSLLQNLPGYDPVSQEPYFLTTSPVVLVVLTPSQINDVAKSLDVQQLTEPLELDPDADEAYDLIYTPNDIHPPFNMETVLDSGYTGDGVVVAVIDRFLDPNPAYDARVIGKYEYLTDDPTGDVASCSPPPSTDPSHGSLVTSLITGQGGVAPNAEIVFYNKGYCNGDEERSSGIYGTEWALDRIVAALELGTEYAPDIINSSNSRKVTEFTDDFYSLTEHCDGMFSKQQYKAISETLFAITQTHGVPIFNSTGNQGVKDGINFPACLSYVTGVGSSADNNLFLTGSGEQVAFLDEVYSTSNTAAHLELVAPGIPIKQLQAFPSMWPVSGTSFSTPITTGSAALLLEKARDCYWSGCGTERIDTLEKSGEPSLLPDILVQTGKPVMDQLAFDPDNNPLKLPRLNALDALTDGLYVPTLQEEQQLNWFVEGYEGELQYGRTFNYQIDSSVLGMDETQYGIELVANDTTYDVFPVTLTPDAEGNISYTLKVSNQYGVSRTRDRLWLTLPEPAISLDLEKIPTRRNKSDLLVTIDTGIGFADSTPCDYYIFANGTYYDTVFAELDFDTFICSETVSTYDLKDISRHNNESQATEFQIQVCRWNFFNAPSEPTDSCSAVHRLPM